MSRTSVLVAARGKHRAAPGGTLAEYMRHPLKTAQQAGEEQSWWEFFFYFKVCECSVAARPDTPAPDAPLGSEAYKRHDAAFEHALRGQRQSLGRTLVGLLTLLFGVTNLVQSEFSDIERSLTVPVLACGAGDPCASLPDFKCVAPGALNSFDCGPCTAAEQRAVDAGAFSREACVSADFLACSSDWATLFLPTTTFRQTQHTISFTIFMALLLALVAAVLVAVEVYFQRRAILAALVLPFHYYLRRELYVIYCGAKVPTVQPQRRHACCGCSWCCACCRRGVNCTPAASLCCGEKKAAAFNCCCIREGRITFGTSTVLIAVVAAAIVGYYASKMATIDSLLWQLSTVPVTSGFAMQRLWAFSVNCSLTPAAAAAANATLRPLTLLLDIDSQRKAAVSAPQQGGLVAKIPSVLFALFLIAAFLGPKLMDIHDRDENIMSDSAYCISRQTLPSPAHRPQTFTWTGLTATACDPNSPLLFPHSLCRQFHSLPRKRVPRRLHKTLHRQGVQRRKQREHPRSSPRVPGAQRLLEARACRRAEGGGRISQSDSER